MKSLNIREEIYSESLKPHSLDVISCQGGPRCNDAQKIDKFIPLIGEGMSFEELVRIADECGLKIEDCEPVGINYIMAGPVPARPLHRIVIHCESSISVIGKGETQREAVKNAIKYLLREPLFRTTAAMALDCIEDTEK